MPIICINNRKLTKQLKKIFKNNLFKLIKKAKIFFKLLKTKKDKSNRKQDYN